MLIRYSKYVSFDNFYEPHKVYAVLNFGPVVIAALMFLKLIFQRDASRKVSLAVNSACLVLFALWAAWMHYGLGYWITMFSREAAFMTAVMALSLTYDVLDRKRKDSGG